MDYLCLLGRHHSDIREICGTKILFTGADDTNDEINISLLSMDSHCCYLYVQEDNIMMVTGYTDILLVAHKIIFENHFTICISITFQIIFQLLIPWLFVSFFNLMRSLLMEVANLLICFLKALSIAFAKVYEGTCISLIFIAFQLLQFLFLIGS